MRGIEATLQDIDGGLRRQARAMLRRLVRSPRLPFELRARLLWREQQGAWLARRPDTFNEKVRWRMLKDRRPILTTFADKVAVREVVARLAGSEYLTECLAVVADARELDRTRLPREFVVKASHASGGVWIVSDGAPDQGVVKLGPPIVGGGGRTRSAWNWILASPDRLDWDLLVARCADSLSASYDRLPPS